MTERDEVVVGAEELEALVREDRWRMRVLHLLADLDLEDAYVTGCFARDAVWDAAHRRAPQPVDPVEVTYVDRARTGLDIDAQLQVELSARAPKKAWKVENAARRGADVRTVHGALRGAPDTTRAVGVRFTRGGNLEILAPYGLEDVFGLILRPTRGGTLASLRAEAENEGWVRRFPRLQFREPA